MNINEMYSLCAWMENYGRVVGSAYDELSNVLQANVSQTPKQPIKEPWSKLRSLLRNMPVSELNLQQLDFLEAREVHRYFGGLGVAYVRKIVTQSGYDPASSANELQQATAHMQKVVGEFRQLKKSLEANGIYDPRETASLAYGQAFFRIQFQSNASIDNIASFKKWSSDWNDIVRGVGLCVGERPEDVQVTGAASGSIIVCVVGSVFFVSALAVISKKVSSIVLDGLQVSNSIEDLRHKKILNQEIERILKKEYEERSGAAADVIFSELKALAGGNFQQEHEGHIRTAINKYLSFSKKGGVVDYIQPPEPPVSDESTDSAQETTSLIASINGLREEIKEIRSMKADIFLLENKTQNDVDEDVDL